MQQEQPSRAVFRVAMALPLCASPPRALSPPLVFFLLGAILLSAAGGLAEKDQQVCPTTCGDTVRGGFIFAGQATLYSDKPKCAAECIALCRTNGSKYYDFGSEIGCECYKKCPPYMVVNRKAYFGAISACPAKPACLPRGFFPVTCTADSSTVKVLGVEGRRYTCSFTNPSKTLPIFNYKLTTENFDPLTVGKITSTGAIVQYIPPGGSFKFSFVNRLALGTPKLESIEYPHEDIQLLWSTQGDSKVHLKCSNTPDLIRFDDDMLGKFPCNVTNTESRAVRNLKFEGSSVFVQTSNFNPDYSMSVILAPKGKAGSVAKFSITLARGVHNLHLKNYDRF